MSFDFKILKCLMGAVMPLYGGTRARSKKGVCVCVSTWLCECSTCACLCDWVIECVCTIHCSGLSDSLWISIDYLSSALSFSLSLPSYPVFSLMVLYQQSTSLALLPLLHFSTLHNRNHFAYSHYSGKLAWNILRLSEWVHEGNIGFIVVQSVGKRYIT